MHQCLMGCGFQHSMPTALDAHMRAIHPEVMPEGEA
jgi:hypothetical protein